MPEEMRAALNKFFTLRFYKTKRRSSRKKIEHFQKKVVVYYFSVLTIVDPLKGAQSKCFRCLPS